MDYSLVLAHINRQDVGVKELSASSFVVLFNALSAIEGRNIWNNAGAKLNNTEWDTVENWLSVAAKEILAEYECEDDSAVVDIASFWYQKTVGSDGDARTGGGAANILDWSNASPLNTVDLVDWDEDEFTPISGVYLVTCEVSTNSVGWNRLALIRGLTIDSYGNNTSTDSMATYQRLVSTAGSDVFRWTHECTEAGYGGRDMNEAAPEFYHVCTWQRVGDAS